MRSTLAHHSKVYDRYREQWKSTLAVGAVALVALSALLYLLYALIAAAVAWTTVKLDDIHYGYPRTFQMDGVLVAGKSHTQRMHFLAQNLQGRVWITIVPGDNAGRVLVIKGPQLLGPGRDLAPATLALQDVNRDGYSDLVLYVDGKTLVYHQDPHRQRFVLSGDRKAAR